MVFFKSAKLPGARGRSNYYSSILLRDLCKAVANLNTPRNSRLTFHSLGQMPTTEEPQCGPLRLFMNWFRPWRNCGKLFLFRSYLRTFGPDSSARHMSSILPSISSAISSIKTVRPGSPSVKNLTAFAFAYCRWDSRAQTSA